MALKSLSTIQLRKELERRERGAERLQVKRAKLARQMDAIDAELASLGVKGRTGRGRATPVRGRGRKTTSGRRRAKNDVTLPDAIAGAMEVGAVVSPKEAADLVKRNGYKTASKTFNVQVSQALAKDSRFKRVGRGQHERIK